MSAKINVNKAAVEGLILAAASIILLLVGELFEVKFLNTIIWLVKLAVTMYLLYFFMKRNTQTNSALGIKTTSKDAFRYGFVVSIFSVILISAFQYLMLSFTDQDIIREKVWEQLNSGAYSQFDFESSESTINMMLNRLPLFVLLYSLFIYTIWSLIASAILSGSTKSSDNPFEDTDKNMTINNNDLSNNDNITVNEDREN